MRRFNLLAIGATVGIGSIWAQIPGAVKAPGQTASVFKVWHDYGNDKWYGQNLVEQEITGYVIHVGGGDLHVSQSAMNVAPAELEYHPIHYKQVVDLPVRPMTLTVDIPAVILANGTVVGVAKTVEGLDVVDEMFQYRTEEHNEYLRLAALLRESEPGRAIEGLRSELAKPLSKDTLSSEQITGIGRAHAHMLAILSSTTSTSDLYAALRQEVEKRTTLTERFSSRRGQ